MSETDQTSTPTKVCIFSLDREIGEAFIQTICKLPAPVDRGSTKVGDCQLMIELIAGELGNNPKWKESIEDAKAAIVLVQFMDILSTDALKKIVEEVSAEKKMPTVYCLFREDGQTDYKISCPVCGQKLWVRDQDAGKRGRCPNCKNHFVLPSQIEGLKSKMDLLEDDEALRFVRKDLQMGMAIIHKVLEKLSPKTTVTQKTASSRPPTKKVIFIKR